MFKCDKCDLVLNNKKELIAHFWFKHKINAPETILRFYHDGIQPKCKCGCGQETKYQRQRQEYSDFLSGHNSASGNNNFKKGGIEKSIKIRKERAANGDYKGKASDELRRIRSENSKGENNSNFGVKPSKETKEKQSQKRKEYFENNPEARDKLSEIQKEVWTEERREQQREKRYEYFSTQQMTISKTELLMEDILIFLNLEYKRQFRLKRKIFDFLIINTNILVEVDGDFWHCNPIRFSEPKYKQQIHNLNNDAIKNKIAEENGYKLLRFWEYDIIKHPDKVIAILKEKGL
jgi:very-short-patch-repair endonuclease